MSYALVIDDNRNTADALVEMLDMLGIDARAAYGSSPAMAMLKSISPPLILLDINMPGVTGLEILAYLKREPRLSRSKVIVITSDDQPETKQQALDSGALALILKPASLPQLEEVLKKAGML
jgi:CheY-like chemotaxis protein